MADAKKVKKASEDFEAKYGMQGPEGTAPEEAGADDSVDQVVPSFEEELTKNGWVMGATPSGPAAVEKAAATKTGSIISQLRKAGLDEGQIAKAAEEVRLAGTTRFLGPGGKVQVDVGYGSPLGKELAAYGKELMAKAEAAAPTVKYPKMFKDIGRAGP